jgi:hypothetical protein
MPNSLRTSQWLPFALALSALLIVTSTCFAGPPFVTDDPEPVDLHHYELYLGGAVYQKTATDDFTNSPFVEFNYGLLPNLQVHIIVNGAYNRLHDGGKAYYGLGDTELGAKYRFIQESDWVPQVGIYPMIEVSTGNGHEGLGNGQTEFFLPVWAQKSWGDWTVYGGGGFFYNPAPDDRSFWRFGVVVQRDLNKRWTLGAEVYHETPGGGISAATYVDGHTAFNLGVIYNINDNTHLLFSAGRDFQGPTVLNTYLSIQFTW